MDDPKKPQQNNADDKDMFDQMQDMLKGTITDGVEIIPGSREEPSDDSVDDTGDEVAGD